MRDCITSRQAYWRVTSKRVVDNACMLLESSFLDQVVEKLETQLLVLTQELSVEDKQHTGQAGMPLASPSDHGKGSGWQRPRLGIFDVSCLQPHALRMTFW